MNTKSKILDKKYLINSKRLKITAFFYFISSLFMITSMVILKGISVVFIITAPILFLLSIYLFIKSDKIIQLKISSGKLFFIERKNYGKYRFQDSYNLLFKSKLEESICLSEIQDVELEVSLYSGNQIFIHLKNGETTALLLNSNKAQLEEIQNDLSNIINEK